MPWISLMLCHILVSSKSSMVKILIYSYKVKVWIIKSGLILKNFHLFIYLYDKFVNWGLLNLHNYTIRNIKSKCLFNLLHWTKSIELTLVINKCRYNIIHYHSFHSHLIKLSSFLLYLFSMNLSHFLETFPLIIRFSCYSHIILDLRELMSLKTIHTFSSLNAFCYDFLLLSL